LATALWSIARASSVASAAHRSGCGAGPVAADRVRRAARFDTAQRSFAGTEVCVVAAMPPQSGANAIAAFDVFRTAGFSAAARRGRTTDSSVPTTLRTGDLTIVVTTDSVGDTATLPAAQWELGETLDAVVAADAQCRDAVPFAALLVGLAAAVLATLLAVQAATSLAAGLIRRTSVSVLAAGLIRRDAISIAARLTCAATGPVAAGLSRGAARTSARTSASGRNARAYHTSLTRCIAVAALTRDRIGWAVATPTGNGNSCTGVAHDCRAVVADVPAGDDFKLAGVVVEAQKIGNRSGWQTRHVRIENRHRRVKLCAAGLQRPCEGRGSAVR
jgi:hypothetical protein